MSGAVAKLTLRYAGGEATWQEGPVRIGRAPDNQWVVADESLSRHHAEVTLKHGIWVIRDLQSANGIWIGGVRVPSARLRAGDKVILGQVAVEVLEATGAAPAANRRVPYLLGAIAVCMLLVLRGPAEENPIRQPPLVRDDSVFAARTPAPPDALTVAAALKLAERNLQKEIPTGDALVRARHALAWAAKLNGGTLPPEGTPLQADLTARLDAALQSGKLAYVRAMKLRRRVEAEAAMRMLRETFPYDDPRSIELDRLEAVLRE